MPSANQRRNRKDRGLCPACGQRPPESGRPHCQPCISKDLMRKERLRSAGLCYCGKPPALGQTTCQRCIDRTRAFQAKRSETGSCRGCGTKAIIPQRRYCLACLEVIQIRNRSKHRRQKQMIIQHYGGVCQSCGESHLAFLTIDHLEGGGTQHQRSLRAGGLTFYRWLRTHDFPAGFQCLCWNCNCGKERQRCQKASSRWNRDSRQRRKARVIRHYGGRCTCCGVEQLSVLTIDHPQNNGREERQRLGRQGMGHNFYRWLIKQGFPPGYAVLCFNCNCGRARNGGVCPHKQPVSEYWPNES